MDQRTAISPLRALTARRAVGWAILTGLATWIALNIAARELLPVARILIAWDVGVLLYLVSVFWLLHDASPAEMAQHASQHKVGRHFVLAISIAAVIVSLAVIVFEIRAISAGVEDGLTGIRIAFVLTTVALSWLFIHTSFATHYAFEYYGAHEDGSRRGGLEYPSGEDPDFWDVWNFSVVIGICFATADINITSSSIRRITTVHGICAFLFNTVLLAATVSFAGAFLRPDG
jgi:uncharacterized membrane protein